MEWIIPANPNYYKVNEAFKKNKIVYWKQTVNYAVGDIVYIYCIRPLQKIMLKTYVVQTDVALEDTYDDSEFFVHKENYHDNKTKRCVKLKLIKYIDDEGLELKQLLSYGLKGAPQGPLRIKNNELISYIESILSQESENKEEQYEREVISIPASSTIELINKYRIHAHPNNSKSYPYKKSIYYAFRAKYGFMDRLFSLYDTVLIDPNNLSMIDELQMSDDIKKRIFYYINERKIKYYFTSGEIYKFYIFDKCLMIPKPVKLPGQNNHAYLEISEMYSGKDIVERCNKNIQNYVEEYEKELIEGSVEKIIVNKYERNKKARKECINYYGAKCYVCGFDFERKYGSIGKGIIEVHHKRALYQIKKEYKVNPIKDLIPVCPNCHRVIHSRKPSYDVEELKGILGNY